MKHQNRSQAPAKKSRKKTEILSPVVYTVVTSQDLPSQSSQKSYLPFLAQQTWSGTYAQNSEISTQNAEISIQNSGISTPNSRTSTHNSRISNPSQNLKSSSQSQLTQKTSFTKIEFHLNKALQEINAIETQNTHSPQIKELQSSLGNCMYLTNHIRNLNQFFNAESSSSSDQTAVHQGSSQSHGSNNPSLLFDSDDITSYLA